MSRSGVRFFSSSAYEEQLTNLPFPTTLIDMLIDFIRPFPASEEIKRIKYWKGVVVMKDDCHERTIFPRNVSKGREKINISTRGSYWMRDWEKDRMVNIFEQNEVGPIGMIRHTDKTEYSYCPSCSDNSRRTDLRKGERDDEVWHPHEGACDLCGNCRCDGNCIDDEDPVN